MVAALVNRVGDKTSGRATGPVSGVDTAARLGILVVDDEESIRSLLRIVLQRYGFAVWVAASGGEALDVYARHQHEIGLALLDVRMPGLDGPQTLAALRRIRPGLRICFMSGHTGEYTEKELIGYGAEQVIAKPFRMNDLAASLRQPATRMERRSA